MIQREEILAFYGLEDRKQAQKRDMKKQEETNDLKVCVNNNGREGVRGRVQLGHWGREKDDKILGFSWDI